MCNAPTMQILSDCVSRRVTLGQDWVAAGSLDTSTLDSRAMFTAFDITQEARLEHGVTERHGEIKGDVHGIFDNGQMDNYERCLITPRPGVPEAWLYFPEGADWTQYKSKWAHLPPATQVLGQAVASIVQQAALGVGAQLDGVTGTCVGTISSLPATITSNIGNHQVDNRGRLCIPTEMIKNLGLNIGEWAYAYSDGNSVVVAKSQPTMGTSAYSYLVDKSGNVRVSQACLVEAGIGGTHFDIVEINDTIVVKRP